MSISRNLKWILIASFAVLLTFAINATETQAHTNYRFCTTSNTLKLYSGYSSRGQAHLREDVRSLQQLINDRYDPVLYFTPDVKLLKMPDIGNPDGYFGSQTQLAVIVVQQIHGLDPDGIVGPKTRGALCSPLGETVSRTARKQ